jgi:DNA-binding transcriptional LysR family regulator
MMFEWDDLRVFIAAARAGSLGGAAKQLGIDTATVGRRLARLESMLKSTLVARSKRGLQLTALGSQLLEIALEAEISMDAAARVTAAQTISGTIRIAVTEGFGSSIVAPALHALITARPGLKIELATSPRFLTPARREVDMAITLSAPTSQRLVVEPLTDYQLALYASQSYLDREGTPETTADLRNFGLVGFVQDLLYAPDLGYFSQIREGLTPTLGSTSIQVQRSIVANDGGIGVLPCFMAEGLTRVLADEVLLVRRLWLSALESIHETARIRVVRNWLRDVVEAKRAVLMPF